MWPQALGATTSLDAKGDLPSPTFIENLIGQPGNEAKPSDATLEAIQAQNKAIAAIHTANVAEAAQQALEQATEQAAQQAAQLAREQQQAASVVQPSQVTINGNDYDPGSCVWYVAGRISVPATMGDAKYWIGGLEAAGWTAGSPRVGSIGITTAGVAGHAVVVQGVTALGVLISEMNAPTPYVVDQRIVGYSDFVWLSH